MGIDYNVAKFLLWSRAKGLDYTRCLTIGRQGLHLSSSQLTKALREFAIARPDVELAEAYGKQEGYAEPFFRLLGSTTTDSLDASGFEGATHIHDMNKPVTADWQGKYSVVFDGGCLEHVFDYPMALRNCMNLVEVGGHFLSLTPANNYMGHGFYQLSPELFARVFQEENGFVLEKMVLLEQGSSMWYEVVDPRQVGRRVRLVNRRPTLLGLWARKTHAAPFFTRTPQQSDYSDEWSQWSTGENASTACRETGRQERHWLRRWFRSMKKWFRPRFPSKFYKPVRW